MRVLTCAGGTGGGVYPALTVLNAMNNNIDMLWVGGEGGMEAALVQRAGIPFEAIPAAGVHGVGIRQLPRNIWRLARGYRSARHILKRFRPDVLFFTGGFLAFPMALAGWRIPMLVFVPDIEPALAIKAIAPFANVIAVSTEESRSYFNRKNIVLTGYPTRSSFQDWTSESGKKQFGLSEELPVLLIAGGSRGARSINLAVIENLAALLEFTQVIHISGELDWKKVETAKNQLGLSQTKRYFAYPYLHEEMGAALAAADLVVSRAGASTLGEYPLFGLPAILVPYPFAWRYQQVNAQYLVQNLAAVLLEDSHLGTDLLPMIKELLSNQQKLQSMRLAMRGLSQPTAAKKIAEQLIALAGKR